MKKAKPCPLCGGIVIVETDKKILPPTINLYGDSWFGCFRVQIKCKPCCLSMDITYNNDYETENDALSGYENVVNEVIGMWNRRTHDQQRNADR